MRNTRLVFILIVLVWAVFVVAVWKGYLAKDAPEVEVVSPQEEVATEPVETPRVTVIPAVEVDLPLYHQEALMFYPVPLDQEIQTFIIRTCEDHHIDPAIVVAMIDQESDFRADCIGDGGKSAGLMQVQERYHRERMDKLGVTDLANPLQNVAVGIDYLVELVGKYDGNIEKALMAFNAGPTGAYEHWFSRGIYSNSYSEEVLETSKNLKEAAEDVYFQI